MIRFRAISSFLLAGLCWSGVAMADERRTDREAVILARVLAYDRNLKSRAGDSVTIAVLSGSDARGRAEAAQTLRDFRQLEKLKVAGLSIQVILVEYRSQPELQSELARNGVDTVYLCAGLESALEDIIAVTHAHRILSIGSRTEQIKNGISIGAFVEDGGYKIHVNLASSRAEGAAFASDLLALARVIR